MTPDVIRIEELTVEAFVGVPDAERQNPQRLVLCLTLTPVRDFRDLRDALERTVDYAEVVNEITTFVRTRETKLIETLADNVATHLLARFPLRQVELDVRKFILPETKYVSVHVIRAAEPESPRM